ncbi:hypothetical protein GCM10011348_39710 [Marinobacterium nitratireducens]|uniref:Uncharacterized protein n=1 Tax=Marinobacterium nitratireducens TaxID=518897 RepID=A0A918DW49_9GAMM|nr:DUF211 domain-containing protein [Marinobacterium nitratireducens]GGO87163.1 hypothetical protein GCM10011348_39710 [Marinobacterium nitratireducens]
MAVLTRVVLDVLKPQDPSVLELARVLSDIGGYRVRLQVLEMDKNTETLAVEISAPSIDFDAVHQVISDLGASLHSVDEVDFEGSPDAAEPE